MWCFFRFSSLMRNEFKTRTRKRREMWPRRQRRKSTEKQSLRKEQKGKGFRVRARKRAMRGEWRNIFAFCLLLFSNNILVRPHFSNLWQFYGWRSDEQKQAGDKMCMLMNLRMCVLINFEICVIILTTDIPLPCNCLNMHIIFLYEFMFPFHIIL